MISNAGSSICVSNSAIDCVRYRRAGMPIVLVLYLREFAFVFQVAIYTELAVANFGL